MNSQDFEPLFALSVESQGEDYRSARDRILQKGPTVLKDLRERETSPDWRIALQSDIFLGWLTNNSMFTRCTTIVNGLPPDERYTIGRPPLREHLAALRTLGPETSPCLLEVVLKRRPLEPEARMRATGALSERRPRFMKEALLSLLGDEDHDLQKWAACDLARFVEPDVTEALVATLTNASQVEKVRACAAKALGSHPSNKVGDLLRRTFADEAEPEAVRIGCLNAIEIAKDESAVLTIIQAAKHLNDTPFRSECIYVLGKLGNPSAIPFLESLKNPHDEYWQTHTLDEALSNLKKHHPLPR